MTELEIKANAMLSEIRQQREFYSNRCASLCADLAIAATQIEALQKRVEELTPKAPADSV